MYETDVLILCVELNVELNDGVPNIPKFPINKGSEVFNGMVIHSMEHSNKGSSRALELIRGKRVNVVKSAIDIAAERAKVNGK